MRQGTCNENERVLLFLVSKMKRFLMSEHAFIFDFNLATRIVQAVSTHADRQQMSTDVSNLPRILYCACAAQRRVAHRGTATAVHFGDRTASTANTRTQQRNTLTTTWTTLLHQRLNIALSASSRSAGFNLQASTCTYASQCAQLLMPGDCVMRARRARNDALRSVIQSAACAGRLQHCSCGAHTVLTAARSYQKSCNDSKSTLSSTLRGAR